MFSKYIWCNVLVDSNPHTRYLNMDPWSYVIPIRVAKFARPKRGSGGEWAQNIVTIDNVI
jgi:hypothetical protein